MNAGAIKLQGIERSAGTVRGRGKGEATILGEGIMDSLRESLLFIGTAEDAALDLDTLRDIGGTADLGAAAVVSAIRKIGGWRALKSGDKGFTAGMLTLRRTARRNGSSARYF